jgi:hypothetical protein
MCSLRFENNLLSSEGVRFASISKKTPLSNLSFAFVSLALPLLLGIRNTYIYAHKILQSDTTEKYEQQLIIDVKYMHRTFRVQKK